ncbi:hypothetical protein [Ensifer sp. YR511]|uniref:hypothetical protein n=1 Tax=Ensifer sp. YR511 TaxID=1855294 RepID=UPI00115FA5BB|nr:hypothetical protein [Ensifer sp. YR511]
MISTLGMAARRYETHKLTQEQLDAMIKKHSLANIFKAWAEDPERVRSCGAQLAIHRLLFDWSRGIPDNSTQAGAALLEAGLSCGERDISITQDRKFIAAHPMSTGRFLLGESFTIAATPLMRLIGKKLVIQQVSDGQFTGKSHSTDEAIESYDTQLRHALMGPPGYNEIVDARNSDGGDFIVYAWKNLQSQLTQILIQTYPYSLKTYDDFATYVLNLYPMPTGWQKSFNMAACVTAETLLMMARTIAAKSQSPIADTSVRNLEGILENYYAPWMRQPWKMFAANLGISDAGNWLSADEQSAKHPESGHVFKNPDIIETIKAIKAINNYNNRLRTEHPHVMRIAMARTPDFFEDGKPFFFSMVTGKPAAWAEKGTEERYLTDAAAGIPYALKNADLVMTDDPIGCLEIIAGEV